VLVYATAGAAKKAGIIGTSMALDGSIQLGDIVLSINGIDVNSDLEAYSIVQDFKPGAKLNVKVLRRMKNKYIQKNLALTLQ